MVEALKIGHAAIGNKHRHPHHCPHHHYCPHSSSSFHHDHYHIAGEICDAIDAFQVVAGKAKKTDTLRQLPAHLVDDIDSVK